MPDITCRSHLISIRSHLCVLYFFEFFLFLEWTKSKSQKRQVYFMHITLNSLLPLKHTVDYTLSWCEEISLSTVREVVIFDEKISCLGQLGHPVAQWLAHRQRLQTSTCLPWVWVPSSLSQVFPHEAESNLPLSCQITFWISANSGKHSLKKGKSVQLNGEKFWKKTC